MNNEVLFSTLGMCYYCGENLLVEDTTIPDTVIATIDHVVPRKHGGGNNIENLVPSCRSCNASKGTKTLDEFRFWFGMEEFRKVNGVRFSPDQYTFLVGLGIDIGFKVHEFFAEKMMREILEIILRKRKERQQVEGATNDPAQSGQSTIVHGLPRMAGIYRV